MNLEHEFNYIAFLKPAIEVGPGPFGIRQCVEFAGGTFKGKRLNGTVLGGGADWLLIGPDGCARMDVRINFQTHDGAALYGQTTGVLQELRMVLDAWGKGSKTEFADHYFRAKVTLESGDARYSWVNQTIFVAEVRAITLNGPAIEYSVYRVT